MTTGMADPFPGDYDASDPFGNIGVRDPAGPGHLGSDWPEPVGTPTPAICRGVIVNKGFDSGNGGYITFSMGDTGLFAAYIHSDSIPAIGVGDSFRQGDIIFYTGNSGTNSFGPHLHITMSHTDGAWEGLGTPFDPYAYITSHLGPDSLGNVWMDPSTGQLYAADDGAGNLYVDPTTGQLMISDTEANLWRDPTTGQLFKAT